MKTWVILAILLLVGFGLGWQGVTYGLSQTWWPLSVSGEPEVILSGTLTTSAVANPTGLFIQSSGQNHYVDLSQIKASWLERNINHQVVVRGQLVPFTPSDYFLVSWAR